MAADSAGHWDDREAERNGREGKPLRVLIVMPSWVGDVVMATPALRLIRDRLRGSFIGALVRPGMDEVLAGSGLVDEMHVERARGVMGPKAVAGKVRPRRYEAALLLTNSFSTALITRLAFIPERVGYDRDGRGLLLTKRIRPRMKGDIGVIAAMGIGRSGYAVESAVESYLRAARVFLGDEENGDAAHATQHAATGGANGNPVARLELGLTPEQEAASATVLARAGIHLHSSGGAAGGAGGASDVAYAILNPGGNNPAKRWPVERFAEVGAWVADRKNVRILVNGSPGEREVVEGVVRGCVERLGAGGGARVVNLLECGVTLGALKGVVKGARLMVTNDTGPRHIAAAFGVPTVSLFGPTDQRWTTLPGDGRDDNGKLVREEISADPTLPETEVADEHPERCRIDRIEVERVIGAVERVW